MDDQKQTQADPVMEQVASEHNNQRIIRITLYIIFAIVCVVAMGSIFWALQQGKESPISEATVDDNNKQEVTNGQTVSVQLPVLIDPTGDLDRDGIPDTVEAELGTSDTDFDSDGDGLSDYDEINYWFTDPTKFDTDGDGFGDGFEVLNGYNPNGEGRL